LLLVYLITAIGYGGNFIVFTYLCPMLTDVTGFGAISVSVIILLYGASVAAVAVWGGFAFANMPPLHANVAQIAPEVARKQSMWPRACTSAPSTAASPLAHGSAG
jgi:predicted MFS family arabinose efflux permease